MTRLWTPSRTWFEQRLEGFGGSEAAPLLGISPWQNARQVVETKARRIIPDLTAPEALRLRMGRDMEPILLEHLWETLSERSEVAVPRPRRPSPERMWRMQGFPYVTAHVDGFLADAVVELKTDEYSSLPWGAEDGDPARVVPAPYYVQVQHELAATGRPRALLFVQIGFHAQLLYEVPRLDSYVDALVEFEGQAWARVVAIRERLANDADAVIEDLLPPLEGTQLTEHLRKANPRSSELIRSATADQERDMRDLRATRRALATAEAADEVATAKVQGAIGPAAGITGPEGTITWRTSKDRVTVAWDLVAAALGRAVRDLVRCIPDASWSEILEQMPNLLPLVEPDIEQGLATIESLYTTTKPGSRPFLVPDAWKQDRS